jgi:hypothetical protein
VLWSIRSCFDLHQPVREHAEGLVHRYAELRHRVLEAILGRLSGGPIARFRAESFCKPTTLRVCTGADLLSL